MRSEDLTDTGECLLVTISHGRLEPLLASIFGVKAVQEQPL
jgi:hypothetical protein